MPTNQKKTIGGGNADDGYAKRNGITMSGNATENMANFQTKSHLAQSTPIRGWNQNYDQPNSTEVIGSAANLVGRVIKIHGI